ncbi:MAG: hypothetical protein JXA21_25675 [Anaerolineae bacterium]|nr:hypothetical protein [Anaerolineae bacterium]
MTKPLYFILLFLLLIACAAVGESSPTPPRLPTATPWLPPADFTPPQVEFDAAGAHSRCGVSYAAWLGPRFFMSGKGSQTRIFGYGEETFSRGARAVSTYHYDAHVGVDLGRELEDKLVLLRAHWKHLSSGKYDTPEAWETAGCSELTRVEWP